MNFFSSCSILILITLSIDICQSKKPKHSPTTAIPDNLKNSVIASSFSEGKPVFIAIQPDRDVLQSADIQSADNHTINEEKNDSIVIIPSSTQSPLELLVELNAKSTVTPKDTVNTKNKKEKSLEKSLDECKNETENCAAKKQIINAFRPQLPEFLLMAKDEQRREYIDLETNGNLKRSMKQMALTAWARKCGPNVLAAYQQFTNEQERIQSEERARIDAIVSTLSKGAQKADEEIRSIVENMDLTHKDMKQQLSQKIKKMNPPVWSELSSATGFTVQNLTG